MYFTMTGNPRGDCTCPYSVRGYNARTLREFINEVITETPKEWGYIDINPMERRVEYRWGDILKNEFDDATLDREIDTVSADGGWSRMDYVVTLKD